jgi:hypothetical protein
VQECSADHQAADHSKEEDKNYHIISIKIMFVLIRFVFHY